MEVHSGGAVSLYCATYQKLAFTNSLFECLFFSKQEREEYTCINHCLDMIFMIFFLFFFFLLPHCINVICFEHQNILCINFSPLFSFTVYILRSVLPCHIHSVPVNGSSNFMSISENQVSDVISSQGPAAMAQAMLSCLNFCLFSLSVIHKPVIVGLVSPQ